MHVDSKQKQANSHFTPMGEDLLQRWVKFDNRRDWKSTSVL